MATDREESSFELAIRVKRELQERGLVYADIMAATGAGYSDVNHTVNFLRMPHPQVVKYLRELGIDFPDVKRIKRVVVCA